MCACSLSENKVEKPMSYGICTTKVEVDSTLHNPSCPLKTISVGVRAEYGRLSGVRVAEGVFGACFRSCVHIVLCIGGLH